MAMSSRSSSPAASIDKSTAPPRVFDESFMRMPSRNTAVKFDSAPRRKISDTPPGPPGRLTERPGSRFSNCSTSTGAIASISFRSTDTWVPTRYSSLSRRDSTTTIASSAGSLAAMSGAMSMLRAEALAAGCAGRQSGRAPPRRSAASAGLPASSTSPTVRCRLPRSAGSSSRRRWSSWSRTGCRCHRRTRRARGRR